MGLPRRRQDFSSDSYSGLFGTLPSPARSPSLTLCDTPSHRAPRYASGQRPLTDILAPCAGGRATFSKVIDYKAFAPGGELEPGERELLRLHFEPLGSGLTWRLRTRKSASCSARRDGVSQSVRDEEHFVKGERTEGPEELSDETVLPPSRQPHS